MQQVKAGNLKVLAVTGAQRPAALPDVPTLAETGIKGVDAQPWYGLLGPAANPDAITQRMNKEVQAILNALTSSGTARRAGRGSHAHDARRSSYGYVIKEIGTWGKAVKASGRRWIDPATHGQGTRSCMRWRRPAG